MTIHSALMLIILFALFVGAILFVAWVIDKFFPKEVALFVKIIAGSLILYEFVTWISTHGLLR